MVVRRSPSAPQVSDRAPLGRQRHPAGAPSARRALRRAIVGLLVALMTGAGLVGAAPAQLPVGTAAAQLAEAEAAYAAATAELDATIARQQELGGQAALMEVELRGLGQDSQAKVLAFEATISRARDLAVNAYVRGGAQADLDGFLDAEAATEVVLKLHLTRGRVDEAQDAASSLRSERIEVDAAASTLAIAVAALNAQLDDADAAVADAREAEQRAYTALLEAADALGVAQVAEAEETARQAAEDAEADRAAAEAEAAAAEAQRNAESEGEADDAGDDTPSAVVSPPFVPPAPPSADQADGWAMLRDCESGGNYSAIGGGGMYRGAYQFAQSTWESVGGVGDPATASPAEQDYRARVLYERSGRGQWPLCGRYLR